MPLQTLVKVSVNNLSDARYCAGMGVEMLGFCLDKDSKNFVSPSDFQEIIYWVSGIKIVGEMSQPPENLAEYHFDFLELHDVALLQIYEKSPMPILLKIQVSPQTDWQEVENLMAAHPKVKYFLLHSENLNFSEPLFDKLRELCAKFSIILGFGISPENVKQIVEQMKPQGISLDGGTEIRPGYKDFEDLSEVLELIFVEEE